MRAVKCISLTLCIGVSIHAATIHVPGDQPAIQAGINAAINGDTVLVAPGTYTGAGNVNVDFSGKRILVKSIAGTDQTVILCNSVTETSDRERGFLFHQGEDTLSILDGFTVQGYGAILLERGGGLVISNASPTIKNCRFKDDGSWGTECTRSDARFYDCDFTGHMGGCSDCLWAPEWPSEYPNGSGALRIRDTSHVRVERCQFTACLDSGAAGAAIDCWNSTLVLDSSQFMNNTCWSKYGGGAVYLRDASVFAHNCSFSSNKVWFGPGGAIFLDTSSVGQFTGCEFDANFGSDYYGWPVPYRHPGMGGAVFCNLSTAQFERSVFTSNWCLGLQITPHSYGGAIAALNATVRIAECTFLYNYAQPDMEFGVFDALGSALYANNSPCEIDRTIFAYNNWVPPIYREGEAANWNISCTDIYGNSVGNWTDSILQWQNVNGNFSLDPWFCDAAAGDYHLVDISPCAPQNNSCSALIGAFGIGCTCCVGTTSNVNRRGIVDLADLSALVSYLTGGGYLLICPEQANVDNAGIVDLGDLSALVSYLTGGGYVLSDCP